MMWDQKIIDKQCESTKRIMLAQNARPIEDDDAYISLIKFTPIVKEAQCVKEDGTVDLNVRELTQTEADFHQGVRGRRGLVIESLRNDKHVSTITEERRERATNAFMDRFSLESIKNKFKAMMTGLFKPDYAEIVAEQMRKIK